MVAVNLSDSLQVAEDGVKQICILLRVYTLTTGVGGPVSKLSPLNQSGPSQEKRANVVDTGNSIWDLV